MGKIPKRDQNRLRSLDGCLSTGIQTAVTIQVDQEDRAGLAAGDLLPGGGEYAGLPPYAPPWPSFHASQFRAETLFRIYQDELKDFEWQSCW